MIQTLFLTEATVGLRHGLEGVSQHFSHLLKKIRYVVLNFYRTIMGWITITSTDAFSYVPILNMNVV